MERMKWGESECGRRGCPKYLVAAHLLMAHLLHGAPLVLTTTNGALGQDTPLVCLDRRTSSKKTILMAHPLPGAPLVVTTTNGALGQDAPLVCLDRRTSSKKNFYTNGAPAAWCAISSYNY